MHSKLQELTDKIYQEGLEKGNQEANSIIESAKQEAASILDNAKKEAEQILNQAQKKADETAKNTESEIKLTSKQAINALKQNITDVINGSVIDTEIKQKFDPDFTKHIIEKAITGWGDKQTSDLTILLPANEQKELEAYLTKAVKSQLDKGLELKSDANINAGFQVTPKDGSYKVSFTDEDFESFFKQYLRPKLIDILFKA